MTSLLGGKSRKRQKPPSVSDGNFEEMVNLFQQCQDAVKDGLPEPAAVIFVKQGFRPGVLVVFSLIFLALGSLLGFWYGGLKDEGGGHEVQTVKEKKVATIEKVVKQAPAVPETTTVLVRPSAVVPKPPLVFGPSSKPNGLDSLAAETQALKERVRQMK